MQVLIAIYLFISFVLIFFLIQPFFNVFISLFNKEELPESENPKEYDFGIIITAYKNVNITKGLIHSLLNQTYDNYRIYLIADHCDVSNWDINHEKLTLLRPQEPLNLKAKSIIHGIEHFTRAHEYIAIFDADNLAHPNFLRLMNKYANAGYPAIQGQRTAKNLDTFYACADAIGEFYKNYIERYVPYLLKASSVISGSGMAVETELYKAYLKSPEIDHGKHLWKKMLQEDKILQNFLLRRNEKISFAWDAVIYDEKVTTVEEIETQRSRWLYSYFQNMPNSIGIIRRGIQNVSWNQVLFGLITVAPPMFIQLFGAIILAILGLIVAPWMSVLILISLCVFTGNIFLTLWLSKVPKSVWRGIWSIPLFIVKQVFALFKMTNPNKNFKHTEDKVNVSIDDVLGR